MQITIDIPDDTARRIEEHIARAKSDFNSHGPLTLRRLMDMLAEDVGLSITRSGSWEGSNIRTVLTSHGYPWRGDAIAFCNKCAAEAVKSA